MRKPSGSAALRAAVLCLAAGCGGPSELGEATLSGAVALTVTNTFAQTSAPSSGEPANLAGTIEDGPVQVWTQAGLTGSENNFVSFGVFYDGGTATYSFPTASGAEIS